MSKTLRKIIIILVIATLSIVFFQTKTYADTTDTTGTTSTGVIDPDDFKPDPLQDDEIAPIVSKGATLVSVIRVIGIIVTVVCLMLIGIKYMTGSIEEKADYKKSMIPYLIGVLVFFALSQLLAIIIEFANSLNS